MSVYLVVSVCQIKSYPRVIPETLRNKDSRRVKARLAVRERKRLVSSISVVILRLILVFLFLVQFCLCMVSNIHELDCLNIFKMASYICQ